MVTLTKDRNTPIRVGDIREYPVAAATVIQGGSFVVLNTAGDAEPGATALAKVAVGRAEEKIDNSAGAAGDLLIKIRQGMFKWAHSGVDAVSKANIGDICFIVDDQTIAKTDGTATRSVAGRVIDLDSAGVWVLTDFNSLS